jgi:serine/threonine protein kinase
VTNAADERNRRNAKKAQDELDALVTEIKLLCQLRHPNIVFFLGCAVVSHDIIINLEYVSGGSLQSMLRSFGSLPLPTVQRYVKDVLRGLQFLHSKNIIHLDLKPANVLLHIDGSCKVTDFGTSIQMHKLIDSNLVVGTPLYMSPEQARGVKFCSFQSDLWCLGLMVIELLCGHLPFDTSVNSFVHMRRLASDESFKIDIPEELPPLAHSFVSQCLEREPAKRGSCDELLMHSFLFSATNTPLRHSKQHADANTGRKSGTGSLSSPPNSGSLHQLQLPSCPQKVDGDVPSLACPRPDTETTAAPESHEPQ